MPNEIAHPCLERLNQRSQPRRALLVGCALGCLFSRETIGLDHVVFEYLNGLGHRSDFVTPTGADNLDG